MKKRYRCARCGRTTFTQTKEVKCPTKDPQCNGVMLEIDGLQTSLEDL